MYYGYIEKCIHYAMWSWDKVQCLLTHTKVCESQWHGNTATFASIYLWFSHLLVVQKNMCRKVQMTMPKLIEKFTRLCMKKKLMSM